jgi:hypothetical protein
MNYFPMDKRFAGPMVEFHRPPLAAARSGRVIVRLPRIDVRDSLTLCN